ncbi:MAG: response regulator [Methylovulum sp.]|uniref:response regulator n=1 Tax=Methylovulum sp. TaxID=1916980 RepID=UPI002629A1FC|nr:response regulator [Methylovulum sp.]MDD2722826.1 response regulator [Methylovulum sp.]MDD5124412.1 response regulator [Methylovulum sp.]
MTTKKKILIVDDTLIDQHRICTILGNANIDVVILLAQNGKEGLEKARNEHPDLIFMDILMPEMDGFSVCRKITTSADTKDIPVVIVSIKNQPVDKMWATLQGAVAMITKPYTDDQILEQVANFIQARHE